MNTYLTRGEGGAGGTTSQQHRGTVALICARPHLQHLLRLLTRSQSTVTPAREAMVIESPRLGDSPRSEGSMRGGCLFSPCDGGGDRRSSSESPDDAVGDTQSLEREGGLGLGFCQVSEKGAEPNWAGLVRPNPLGWV
jgi:hypothetical protein